VTSLSSAGNAIWPLTDHLNTVRDLADRDESTGAVSIANHRTYDSFGRLVSETNAAVDEVFGFTARFFDEASGLQNNWNRWYDAAAGRWISEDPIGFAASDTNLGRYVGNQAVSAFDPTGLINPAVTLPFYDIPVHIRQAQNRVDNYATLNGATRAVVSTVTLGTKNDYDLITPPADVVNAKTYNATVFGYQCSTEMFLGLGAGKLATAPGRIGKTFLALDAAQNFSNVGQGVYNGDPLQAGLGAIGVKSNGGGILLADRITLFRGVNSEHFGAALAEAGRVRPSLPLWKILQSASPLQHNTVGGATRRSIFTSWTRNCEVADNYALRPSGNGTVLEAQIHPWVIVPSPDHYKVQLQNKVIVPESEVLVVGPVWWATPNPKRK
jgi:RHS repeat-associated protein